MTFFVTITDVQPVSQSQPGAGGSNVEQAPIFQPSFQEGKTDRSKSC